MKKFALPLMAVVTVIAVLVALLSYLRWSPRRALVTVGDQTISKFEYEDTLDKQAGKPVLNKLVYTSLVRQAAQKAGVLPSDREVEARLDDMARRNPQVQAQAQDPVNGRQYREDMRTELALENLRIQHVTASEAEINAFYARNKNAFTLPSQVQTTMVISQYRNDAAVAERLLQQDMKPDVIARQPRLRVAGINGFNVNMAALPTTTRSLIGKTVLSMKPGQIKTVPVENLFLTFKVKSAETTTTPPLSQIHDQVARQVKLLKADPPQAMIATLYAKTPPKFAVAKYSDFFSDVQQYNAQKKTASAR